MRRSWALRLTKLWNLLKEEGSLSYLLIWVVQWVVISQSVPRRLSHTRVMHILFDRPNNARTWRERKKLRDWQSHKSSFVSQSFTVRRKSQFWTFFTKGQAPCPSPWGDVSIMFRWSKERSCVTGNQADYVGQIKLLTRKGLWAHFYYKDPRDRPQSAKQRPRTFS